MESESRHESEQKFRLYQETKALAKEMECPVIALSQLSRTRICSDHRPILSDLRNLCHRQDADVVMFLYRDDYYNEDSDKKI